jgi:phosphoribosylformimino-5-aminoimidazole carboxamide ribotide isomerase
MVRMKIIPVIDILNGVAVHALKGERQAYQPLKSIIAKSTQPLAVAEAFKVIGFSELYLADLDAILGNRNNFSVLGMIAKATGLQLMVDSGVSTLKAAKNLLNVGVSKVVVGTETLSDLGFVEQANDCIGKNNFVVSLDMRAGKVLSKSGEIRKMTPLEVAAKLEKLGVSELIVLDLARVGSRKGVDIQFLKIMLKELNLKVLVGGGIRDLKDIQELENFGIKGVLLATALHSGKISIGQLQPYL